MDRRLLLLLAILIALAPISFLLALSTGSVETHWQDIWRAVTGEGSEPLSTEIIRTLRAPRAAAAFAVGGLLALAGGLLQVLLRNPLADPYVLGVSGGASCAALLALLAGLGGPGLAVATFTGALSATLLVFGLAAAGRDTGPERLLLTGVVVATGFGALVSLILVFAPPGSVPGMLHWLLGDLGNAGYPWLGLATLALGLAAATSKARALNVLARGELAAATLGIEPVRLRWFIYLLASALTAVAVMLAGAIGFLGLVVPQLLRRSGLTDQRLLLPACALLGGSLLTIADTAARSMVAPVQLPVGALTALLGVPVFLYLLARGRTP